MQDNLGAQKDNPLITEDFNQSGKLRSEYRDFLHKYLFALIGLITGFIGLYNYVHYDHHLIIGSIVLSFGAYLALLIAVIFYTDQLLIATHHIRNQESHRDSDDFNKIVALKGLKLFTRKRSQSPTVRYFIPHWTSRNEIMLVIAMSIGSLFPVIFSFYFWQKLEKTIGHYGYITGFLVEVFFALWILNKKIIDIFSPIVLSRLIIPANPVPVLEKTPKSYIPLLNNLKNQTAKRTKLFWVSLLCLFIALLPTFIDKPPLKKDSSQIYSMLYVLIDTLIPSLRYSAMFFFITMLNRYFFGTENYRHNKISIFVTSASLLLGLAFFIFASVLSLIHIFPSLPAEGWLLLCSIILGIISIHFSSYNFPPENRVNLRLTNFISIFWIFLCVIVYLSYKGPTEILNTELIKNLQLFVSEKYSLFIPAGIAVTFCGLYWNVLYKAPFAVVLIAVLIGITIMISALWISAQHNVNLAIFLFTMAGFPVLTLIHLLYYRGGPKWLDRYRLNLIIRHILDYLLLIIIGIIVNSIMTNFVPSPWLIMLMILCAGLTWSCIRKKNKDVTNGSIFLSSFNLILLGFFVTAFLVKVPSDYASTYDIYPAVFGQVVPVINITFFSIGTIVSFFLCATSWSKLFTFDDFAKKYVDSKNFINNKSGWSNIKWRSDISKQRVLNYLKLILLFALVVIAVLPDKIQYANIIFVVLAILLSYVTISEMLFQVEILQASSWKAEFLGMHVLADTIITSNDELSHWQNFLAKHGMDMTLVKKYLNNFKASDVEQEWETFREALKVNIDDSYFALLVQRLTSLFIIEHSVILPSIFKQNKASVLLNASSQIMTNRMRWLSKSNLLLTPLRAFFLIPWWSELVKLYDALLHLNNLHERRTDIISKTPIHSSTMKNPEIMNEITIMLSSDSRAGQEKLLELATSLRDTAKDKSMRFIAFTGGNLFDNAGIPFLFNSEKGKGGVIGVVDNFFNLITQSMRLYPFTRLLRYRPNLIVMSDTSFINVELAEIAKSINKKIRIVYYVPPQSEMYTYIGDKRANRVLTHCDLIFTYSKFQKEFYDLRLNEIKKLDPAATSITKDKIIRISFPQIFNLNKVFALFDREHAVPIGDFAYGFLPGSRPDEWKWSFKLFQKLIEKFPQYKISILLPDKKSAFKLNNIFSQKINKDQVKICINDDLDSSYLDDPDFDDEKIMGKIGKPVSMKMESFLLECNRIIAVSGTAATEASFVRPTKTLYFISKPLYFFMRFLRFKGYQKYPETVESENIEKFFANSDKDKIPNQNNTNWWHFSLVNWVVKRAAIDGDEEAAKLSEILLDERLIFWREIKPFWNKDRAFEKICDDLFSSESLSKWNKWNDSEMTKLRRLLRNYLIDDTNVAPSDIAARNIIDKLLNDQRD